MELAKWEDKVQQYLDKTRGKKVSPKTIKVIWARIQIRMSKKKYMSICWENGFGIEEDEEDIFGKELNPNNLQRLMARKRR